MLRGRRSFKEESTPGLGWPLVIIASFALAAMLLEWERPDFMLSTGIVATLLAFAHRRRAAMAYAVPLGLAFRRSEQDDVFRTLAEASPVGLCVIDGDQLLYVNPQFAKMFGYDAPAQIVNRTPLTRLIAPKDLARFGDTVHTGASTAKFDIQLRFAGVRRDGSSVDIEAHWRRCVFEGRPAVSAALLGVTGREHDEAALVAASAADGAFQYLVEQTLVGIYIIEGGYFRYVNPVFAELFGYESPEDIIDRIPVVGLVAPADRARVVANVKSRTLAAATDMRYSFAGLQRGGSIVDVEVHGRSFVHRGKPAVIGAVIDVTERKRTEAALVAAKVAEGMNAALVKEIAARKHVEEKLVERTRSLQQVNARLEGLCITDPLTGLANRRGFAAAFESDWARGCQLALVMIDIDRFKLYNDRYGHPGGDACLRKVADALSASARGSVDLVARYGGEEFAIILPGTNRAGAFVIAERARAAVAALGMSHPDTPAGIVTVSVGVAAATPTPDSSFEQLLACADAALYKAKRDGRNQVAGSPQTGLSKLNAASSTDRDIVDPSGENVG